MIEVGRVCIKIAGRDAGQVAVIVDVLDKQYVLIDGAVRRRKCNVLHLEPLDKKVDIKKNATHAEVLKVLGLEEKKKKAEKKEKKPRPTRVRTKKVYAAPKKEKKKVEKKVEKKEKKKDE